jgi:hypothetical protein
VEAASQPETDEVQFTVPLAFVPEKVPATVAWNAMLPATLRKEKELPVIACGAVPVREIEE